MGQPFKKQMANVSCLDGTTLIGTRCYYACPAGTVPLLTDPNYCVADITCPSETMLQDSVNQNLCLKVSVAPTNGTCPSGYTKWSTNICYVDCPSYLTENGNTCGKRVTSRQSVSPQCGNSWFYDYVNGSCVVSFVGVLTFILIAVVIVVFLLAFLNSTRQCGRR